MGRPVDRDLRRLGDPLYRRPAGTRLVSSLDPRGQRLDVVNTIYYRQRKGTVAILEEVAANITGWNAKVVEFFRRLGRTRHGLDPAIGLAYSATDAVAQLQAAEGLTGALTRTQIGGFADLRSVDGALRAHTAFDEYFHTADLRVGQGNFGWYNIPHLGVFLWRLISFGVGPVTPVPVAQCPGWYSFDPTGRQVPLFAAGRSANQYGDNWVSPVDGQLPGPIGQALLDADTKAGAGGLGLYGKAPGSALAVCIAFLSPPHSELLPADEELVLRPTYGRFAHSISPPQVEHDLVASYHYGFPSEIGAGPYDRRVGGLSIPTPTPKVTAVSGGGAAFAAAIPANGIGTVTIADSLTYSPSDSGAAELSVRGALTLRSGELQRPLIRLSAGQNWVFTGVNGSSLVLDGLFVSGGDVVLCGAFADVTLSCCTLDPGSAAPGVFADLGASPPPALFAQAVDGRDLAPTRLWVDGSVTAMSIDRCVLGPIRTRGTGTIETLTITNSIVQAIRTSGLGPIEPDEVKDPARFERLLRLGRDPVSALLRALSPGIEALLGGGASPPIAASPPPESDIGPLLDLLNALIDRQPLQVWDAFANLPLSAETRLLCGSASPPAVVPGLNRLLLEDAYPLELADAALAFADGRVSLSRCTILGRIVGHRLQASECILQDLAQVDDTQDGCVRFTAWSDGSIIPRQFESVRIPPAVPLFTATDFGQPGYAQLLPTVDAQILPPSTPSTAPLNTISAGAVDGSEMGAYARDKNPIKQRALLLKFREFMPAGLVPVVIAVT